MRSFLFSILCTLSVVGSSFGGWFLPKIEESDVGRTAVGVNSGYASQGIASDGTYFWTSRGYVTQNEWISPFDLNFTNRGAYIDVNYDSRVKHVGDIAINNGQIYVPVSEFANSGIKEYAAVGIHDAKDGTLLTYVNLPVSEMNFGSGDLAGVEVFDDTILLLEWQKRDSGIAPRIWRANLQTALDASGNVFNAFQLNPNNYVEIASYNANGITLYGDYFLISQSEVSDAFDENNSDAEDDNGFIDIYRKSDILQNANAAPIVSFTFLADKIHAEGITFFNGQLWTAQDNKVYKLELPDLQQYYSTDAPLIKHWEGKGYRKSEWFGWMSVVNLASNLGQWIYHSEHGYLYIWRNSQDDLLYYDLSLGTYFYTNRSIYPWTYSYQDSGDWKFYITGGVAGTRWFYSVKKTVFEFEEEMLSAGEVLFSETFDNLDQWSLWGSPRPLVVAEGNPAPSFKNNGDDNYDSGALSLQTFDYSKGIVIEADAFQNTWGNWRSFVIGLAQNPRSYYGTSSGASASVAIRAQHDNGQWTQCYILYDDGSGGVESETYRFYDDDTSWRSYRIVILPDQRVEFYKNDEHLYTTTNTLSLSYNNQPLILGSRSSRANVLIDNVRVSETVK